MCAYWVILIQNEKHYCLSIFDFLFMKFTSWKKLSFCTNYYQHLIYCNWSSCFTSTVKVDVPNKIWEAGKILSALKRKYILFGVVLF